MEMLLAKLPHSKYNECIFESLYVLGWDIMEYCYIDLFAGCGGLSLGLYNSKWKGLFAIEKNADAFSTLKFNLLDNKQHFNWPTWLPKTNLDINDVLSKYQENLAALQGNVDLVVGGPPCQGFSMAGKRNGDDVRNKLCHAYLKFIELVRPSALFFENVYGFTIGFKNSEGTKTPYSSIIRSTLIELGYNVEDKLIDVSNYGIPQKRKRYILVGFLQKDPELFFDFLNQEYSVYRNANHLTRQVTIHQAIGDLCKCHGTAPCPDFAGYESGLYGPARSFYQKFMRKEIDDNQIPDSHRFAKHRKETIEILTHLMEIYDVPKCISPGDNLVEGLKKRGVTPLKANYPCNTITSIPDDFVHYSEPRIMTVREMARIQSFPDWYCFKGKYTTGGTNRKLEVPRYTQVANAVPPLFAEQVGLVLMELLK